MFFKNLFAGIKKVMEPKFKAGDVLVEKDLEFTPKAYNYIEIVEVGKTKYLYRFFRDTNGTYESSMSYIEDMYEVSDK